LSGAQADFTGAAAGRALTEAGAIDADDADDGDEAPAEPALAFTAGEGSALGPRPHAATAAMAASHGAHAEARVFMRSGESSHIGPSRASSRTIAAVRARGSVVFWLLCAPFGCGSEGPTTSTDDATPSADAADAAGPAVDAAPDACAAGAGEWIGFVEDFSHSGYRLVHTATGPIIVSRDDAGLYAYAGTCTYAACTLAVDPLGGVATCPCHGDAYDFDGLVLTAGPATAPLAHFALTICGRRVYVDAARTVPHTVRTVP
jgi:Rieske Fe-S protein